MCDMETVELIGLNVRTYPGKVTPGANCLVMRQMVPGACPFS